MKVVLPNDDFEVARFKLGESSEGSLILRYDHRYCKEGELVFSFESDQLGGRIVDAAFSFEEIADGQWVCRIGCIQGHAKNDENYSKAPKS